MDETMKKLKDNLNENQQRMVLNNVTEGGKNQY